MKNILLLASKNLAFLLRKNVKFILIVLLFLYPIPYNLYPTYAADSTPSASVQSKLDLLKQEIASKAAKLKSEINKKLQNKAYIGVIKSKSDSTITLASRGGTKVVNINQDTIYDPKLTKKTPLKDEDSIAALGDVDETGVLTARKIVKVSSSPEKTYVWGTVVSISDDFITLKDRSGKNLAVSDKTDIQVKEGRVIIATGILNKNNILEAKFIHTAISSATP